MTCKPCTHSIVHRNHYLCTGAIAKWLRRQIRTSSNRMTTICSSLRAQVRILLASTWSNESCCFFLLYVCDGSSLLNFFVFVFFQSVCRLSLSSDSSLCLIDTTVCPFEHVLFLFLSLLGERWMSRLDYVWSSNPFDSSPACWKLVFVLGNHASIMSFLIKKKKEVVKPTMLHDHCQKGYQARKANTRRCNTIQWVS